jgi:hypothetical protein
MTEFLNRTQLEIINRAASRSVLKENRDAFRKFVEDVLGGNSEPTNTDDVRHACGARIIKYGRTI